MFNYRLHLIHNTQWKWNTNRWIMKSKYILISGVLIVLLLSSFVIAQIIINDKISSTNSLGGSITIDDKLEFKNNAENLKILIDELITIITNLKTVDPISGNLPIDGATASALSSLSTRIGNLLKW